MLPRVWLRSVRCRLRLAGLGGRASRVVGSLRHLLLQRRAGTVVCSVLIECRLRAGKAWSEQRRRGCAEGGRSNEKSPKSHEPFIKPMRGIRVAAGPFMDTIAARC